MRFKKIGALLLSAVLCIGMAAPAFAYGDDTAPVEQPVLPEVVEEDVVTITNETSGALTPEGNLTLVDDYHTDYSDGSGQQFITLMSKSGATFYLVIDRNAKGQNTVHFMNLVDEADLLALMEEEDADAAASTLSQSRSRKNRPKKKPLTPMQTTPKTRATLTFQWRMSRRKPVRRTTQKYNFIGGVCRLTYTSDRLFSCFRYSHNGIRQWCWAFLRPVSHHTFQGSS